MQQVARELIVRPAEREDASAVVEMLRRSIRALCVRDHQNDPSTLEYWLSNKTPENFLTWLENEENYIVVVLLDSEIAGVGLINESGCIHLCYVRPGRQGLGIGRAILHDLEEQASAWELERIWLESTVAACPFYERHGFVPCGLPKTVFGFVLAFPHEKFLMHERQ